MDKYELYAVGHHLSSWPEGLTFNELMDILHGDNEDIQQEIWPWEPLEHYPLTDIGVFITSMVHSLKDTFK